MPFTETVELRGHLIDSLILPKVLDEVLNYGGSFEVQQVDIGHKREQTSYVRLQISAPSQHALERILQRIRQHGAEVVDEGDVTLEPAPADGVFPDRFYVTTNLPTSVRYESKWVEVSPTRMDCAIVFDSQGLSAKTVRFRRVKKGDLVVVGHLGVRVIPPERTPTSRSAFEFMASSVSSEKPKHSVIREVANQIKETKRSGLKVLIVAGPAVVHTGAGSHLARMIEMGYVDILFAGNALAAHDIEQALYGTSLGVYLEEAIPAEEGHEHHIHAINAIRRAGGIRQAVEKGVLKSGIMHACIKHKVEFILAGSLRDDGPLPEVITDVMEAQEAMAARLPGVGLALMIATALHSIATGNMLPAHVKTVCVDINPAVVTKLTDRGTFQAMGLVSDAEPFLRELVENLEV